MEDSFANRVAQIEPNEFNEFVTSYLATQLPFPRILCEDSQSLSPLEIPFKRPVDEKEWISRDKLLCILGPSLRKKELIPW